MLTKKIGCGNTGGVILHGALERGAVSKENVATEKSGKL